MTYIGRFAPTPSGPLHFGSLVAALASYLDAKANDGLWLLRIEDLDPPREDPAASALILQQLLAHELHWDGDVQYQSQHHDRYEQVLTALSKLNKLFPCLCSRKTLQAQQGLHHGQCPFNGEPGFALRFLVDNTSEQFTDRVYGHFQQAMKAVGDQVLKRKDGLYAYQLAVLVDDHDANVNNVVRGVDLLDNTPRQIHLLKQLGWPIPQYMHIPLITNEDGQKLSKQNQATAINLNTPKANLLQALRFMHQPIPDMDSEFSLAELLSWSIKHWEPAFIPNSRVGLI